MRRSYRRALTLIEIVLALLLLGVITGGVVAAGQANLARARQEAVWRTLSALLEIGAQYDAEKGKLPVSVDEIRAFDPRVPPLNPWGRVYIVVPGAALWCVETRVPAGGGGSYASGIFASIIIQKDGEDLRVCKPNRTS